MVKNTQGVGYFTAENIVAVLKAVRRRTEPTPTSQSEPATTTARFRNTFSASGFRLDAGI